MSSTIRCRKGLNAFSVIGASYLLSEKASIVSQTPVIAKCTSIGLGARSSKAEPLPRKRLCPSATQCRISLAGRDLEIALGHRPRDHRHEMVRSTLLWPGEAFMSRRPRIRCAIYTRKSSDEGLDQEFNSLDVQHEACAAYIASQKHEGWVLAKERYDDGGVSGGTLDRPGVQRLLSDIDAGKIDRIIVYKVDRLTRSLADFAKLVDRLDGAGASFVSVTQSFNTATSMGRLTLNVLLSFAQFEREVTAERIRDKIAASKKKGMWMGGNVPLGYDAKDRLLVVNQAEAKTVRTIFDLYREHRNIRLVKAEADRLGLRTKRRPGAKGGLAGGKPFSRGHIHVILSNPIYAGRIRHKDVSYDGAHVAIIDPEVWAEAQEVLAAGAARPRGPGNACEPAPLAGKLFDETGDRLTPSHANKKGRRYRYYVSHRLIASAGEPDATGWRLPAERMERAVATAIATRIEGADFAVRLVGGDSAGEIARVRRSLKNIAARLRRDNAASVLTSLVDRCALGSGRLAIDINTDAIADRIGASTGAIDPSALCFEAPFSKRRRGMETRIFLADEAPEVDPALLGNAARAATWLRELKSGGSLDAIAAREGVSRQRIAVILRLAFLAPDLTANIASGRQPAGLTMNRLKASPHLDLWDEQRDWAAQLSA